MLAVIGAVGQAEREVMLERQREGIAKAKREGRYKGRVPTARRQSAEIIRLKEAGVRPSEIADQAGYRAGQRLSGAGRAGEGGGVNCAHRPIRPNSAPGDTGPAGRDQAP